MNTLEIPDQIAYDPVGEKLYWAMLEPEQIWRCNVDVCTDLTVEKFQAQGILY